MLNSKLNKQKFSRQNSVELQKTLNKLKLQDSDPDLFLKLNQRNESLTFDYGGIPIVQSLPQLKKESEREMANFNFDEKIKVEKPVLKTKKN